MQGNSLLTFTPSHEVLYQAQKLRLGVVGKPSDWLIAYVRHGARDIRG